MHSQTFTDWLPERTRLLIKTGMCGEEVLIAWYRKYLADTRTDIISPEDIPW